MSLAFNSITAFLHMGGYAAYVGSAYLLAFVILLISNRLASRRLKRLQRQLQCELSSSEILPSELLC